MSERMNAAEAWEHVRCGGHIEPRTDISFATNVWGGQSAVMALRDPRDLAVVQRSFCEFYGKLTTLHEVRAIRPDLPRPRCLDDVEQLLRMVRQ